MTTTRATLPSLISSHNACIATRSKQPQVGVIRSILQQTAATSTISRTCEFRHGYDIMNVPYARKETNRDYDGRISNSRRGRTNAQDIRGFSDTTFTTREDTWIQDRGFVACGSERVAGVSGKEEKYSRQEIIKAGRIRLSKKIVAQLLLTVFQDLSDNLSSCYLFTHYSCCHMATSSSAVLFFSTRRQWVLCGGREDTHMFTTIGTSPRSVYPYDLNSSYPIFGGSEAAL